AGEGVATKGGTVVTRLQYFGGLAASETGTDRRTVTQPLGSSHHIRLDAVVLVREVGAGTTVAGLYFVQHQQPFMLVAEGAQPIEVVGRRNPDAAFTLNRFHQDGDY